MSIHFAAGELALRREAAAAELARRGLDGLLMFRQEAMYYLTGSDTSGYVFFQCLYVRADGETLTLLTRTPDVRQAEHTSVISDIRVWYDAEGADPAEVRSIFFRLASITNEERGCNVLCGLCRDRLWQIHTRRLVMHEKRAERASVSPSTFFIIERDNLRLPERSPRRWARSSRRGDGPHARNGEVT